MIRLSQQQRTQDGGIGVGEASSTAARAGAVNPGVDAPEQYKRAFDRLLRDLKAEERKA